MWEVGMQLQGSAVEMLARLLRLCYGLGMTDSVALLILAERGPSTASELARAMGVTRSSAQRSLQRLAVVGLVTRRAEKRGPGRPPYVYALAPDALEKLLAGVDACLRAYVEAAKMLRKFLH